MKIGFLDFGHLLPNKSPWQIIHNTIEYVKLADSKGFSRYWLTEHHSEFVSWAGPEIMMGVLATKTKKIRIGAAGILLNMYSPFKVAENFKLLESISPDRIDLGIGRGTAPKEKYYALTGNDNFQNKSKDFEQKFKLLLSYISNKDVIKPNPETNDFPEIWLLGSSYSSAKLAAECGVAYGYSGFMNERELDSDVIKSYIENFIPSVFSPTPKYNITLAGVCNEDEQRAKDLTMIYPNNSIRISVTGTPDVVAEKLLEFKTKYLCDEIIYLDATLKHEDRLNSIRLLSDIKFSQL